MEKTFGDWYRIATCSPTEDLLKRRWAGIEKFASEVAPVDILDLARTFYQRRSKGAGFGDKFREAFYASDNAFQMTGNDLELAVLAGVCLWHLANDGEDDGPTACSADLAIICPSLQGRAPCGAVPAIQTAAHAHLTQLSLNLRTPQTEEFEGAQLPQAGKMADTIVAASSKGWPEVGKLLGTWLQAVDDATSQAYALLKENALLRAEESNMLWWMTAGFSRDLDRPLSEIDPSSACVVAGKELADLVSVLPGPYAGKALLHRILLPGGKKSIKEVNIKEAIDNVDREWRSNWMSTVGNSAVVDLCPLTLGVNKSLESEDSLVWTSALKSIGNVDANLKMEPVALAYQAYQESLFLKAYTKLESESDE
jgi:hypothetical protein